MFSSLFKCLGSWATVAVGAATTTPFIYTLSTQSTYTNHWRQVINNNGLIVTCEKGGSKYKVVMTQDKKNLDNADLTVSFSLIKEETNWVGRVKKVTEKKWANNNGKGKEWGFKRNSENNNNVMIWHKKDHGSIYRGQEESASCVEEKGIKWEWGSKSRGYTTIDASSIKFEVEDCKSWFFSKTCKIQISSGNNLQKSGIKPTITYYTF